MVFMKKLYFLFLLPVLFIAFVKADYIQEYNAAYTWAFNNWITTQPTIGKANMNWEVTRIELAKMISNYAIKNLKKEWNTSKKCVFTDVTSDLDKQYDNWVTNACQLWLMGQWIIKFRPYDKVTIAEFWTILSRLLYWDKYNWWNPYYIRHINKLKIVWIMSNIFDPDKKNELRGNVMVMLKRSEKWSEKIVGTNEIDDSAFMCNECYIDYCGYEPIERKNFVLPYKNWYIWIHEDILWSNDWIMLTYRSLDDPCDYTFYTDSIYRIDSNLISTKGCFLFNEFSNWKLTKFASNAKNYFGCWLDAEKYFINVLNWKEENAYISFWLKELKKAIDKDTNAWRISFRKEFSDCTNELRNSYKGFGADGTGLIYDIGNFDLEVYGESSLRISEKKVEDWIFCVKKLIES